MCVINAQYNYCIYNSGLFEQCDTEENVEVTGVCTISCLKRIAH